MKNEWNYMKMTLKVTNKRIDSLIPYVNNARTHSTEQVAKIAASIKEFGFNNPILIDKDGGIIAGHGRLEAAKLLSLTDVPTICLGHLTNAQRKAYILADNRLAMDAGWDAQLLKVEFDLLLESGVDLSITGFNADEIQAYMNPIQLNDGLTDADNCDGLGGDPVSKPGDIWVLANHRLMCGDATNILDVESLLKGQSMDMVYTDPPYGIDENTDRVRSKRTQVAKAGVYDKIIGDTSTRTAIDAYNLCASLNIPIMIFWGGNYYVHSLPETGNWLVWDKREDDIQRDVNSDAELAWVKSRFNSVRLFRHLWKGMIKASENGEGRVHPTQKPVALADWCFSEYAEKAKNILDLFGGSGSTLVACEKTARNCFMMELDPKYCDVIVKRWQKFTGHEAILESEGKPFNELSI